MKNPRKRISVSIYIPDRHRPLLRGDEFNRRIPFTLVKSFQTYRVEFSTIFRIITSFDRRFLSFFSSLSFPLLFFLFSRTPSHRARRFILHSPREQSRIQSIGHGRFQQILDPHSLPTPPSSPHLRTSPRYKRMHARVSCSFEQRGESVASDLQPSAIRVRSVQRIKLSPLHRMYK